MFHGFEPLFEDRGPRVEGDRSFAEASSGRSSEKSGDDEVPDLETDIPWIDILDEVEEGEHTSVESVGADDRDISFVFMS